MFPGNDAFVIQKEIVFRDKFTVAVDEQVGSGTVYSGSDYGGPVLFPAALNNSYRISVTAGLGQSYPIRHG